MSIYQQFIYVNHQINRFATGQRHALYQTMGRRVAEKLAETLMYLGFSCCCCGALNTFETLDWVKIS